MSKDNLETRTILIPECPEILVVEGSRNAISDDTLRKIGYLYGELRRAGDTKGDALAIVTRMYESYKAPLMYNPN